CHPPSIPYIEPLSLHDALPIFPWRDDERSSDFQFRGDDAAANHLLAQLLDHRSTSPNTMSSEPRMAESSASMWPRFIQSMACSERQHWAEILQRYGLLVPSETR